jgi:glucose-1-phosphate thymidylyltransferase
MKVIVPLAGFGTRLRPHTYTRPKPLVSVAGKPVLGHILDKLTALPIEEIIFVVGYLGDQIRDYVGANYHFPARYVEQRELKGQAHAIYLAKDYISGPVLIVFVDTIFDADLKALPQESADGIIYVKEVDDPRRFGVVITENGVITKLVEKPATPVSNLAVIGVYYVKDSQLMLDCIAELIRKDIKTQGEYFLADAFQLMIDRGTRFVARTVDRKSTRLNSSH